MYLNKFKIIRLLKWGLYYLFKPFFIFEHYLYKKFKTEKKIRRLFITTGNIALVNILALLNSDVTNNIYIDNLIVDTGVGKDNFMQKQIQLSSLHNFDKFPKEIGLNPGVQIVLHNIFNVDEIYMLNLPNHLNTILPLFKNLPIKFISEGSSSYISNNFYRINNLQSFIMTKFLNKLDIIDKNCIKLEELSSKEFRTICRKISELEPLKLNITQNSEDKYILYCSIYWQVLECPKEYFIKLQSEMLDSLIARGYKILYKPHPRDIETYGYDLNPNVKFIDSYYPIEIYPLDVLGVVSITSSSSISYAHYWNVPGFSNVTDEILRYKKQKSISDYILKEYSLNYNKLFEYDVLHTSKNCLRKQIYNDYIKFISKLPDLSMNVRVKNYVESLKNYAAK